MTRAVERGALIVVLALVSAAAATGDARAQAPAGIAGVAWMQGCWELTAGNRVVEEMWTAPRAGTMLGVGRTIRDGALVEHEFVIIRERDGHLVYIAHPSGQAPAEFTSTVVTGQRVVFEDLAHDFPQRVSYERQGASLNAFVEGTIDGRMRRIEFSYRRRACPTD